MERSNEKKSRVTKKEILTYGVANGGQVMAYGLVSSYLLYYYINVFHVDPKIIAAIFFIGGIWDIVNNPVMGFIIDRKNHSKGKLTYFLRRFTVPLGIATVFLFLAPYIIKDASPVAPAKIIYVIVSYFLWELLYTITDVAFGGLAATISPVPADRQKMITVSNICQQIGGGIIFLIVPIMLDITTKTSVAINMREVFLILGLLAGIVGIGLFSTSGFVMKERIRQTREQPSIKEMLKSVFQNRPLILLLSYNFISVFATVGMAFSVYYYMDVLGYASLSIVIEGIAMVVSFLSYSFITPLKKHLNNKNILILATLAVSMVEFIIFFIGLKFYSNTKAMVPILIIGRIFSAVFMGILNVLPTEMLTETADYSELKTGLRNEGIIFSLRNSTNKINGTIVPAIVALILGLIGYVGAKGDVRAEQTQTVQQGLWIAFSLIPALMHLLGAIPIFFYDLVGEKRENMLRELEKSRMQNSEKEKVN